MKRSRTRPKVEAVMVGEGYALKPADFEYLAAHLRLSPLPDFAADDTPCVEALNALLPSPVVIAPALSGEGWSCVFEFADKLHLTAAAKTEGLAAALGLLFVLRTISHG